jgi:hypothetical protein
MWNRGDNRKISWSFIYVPLYEKLFRKTDPFRELRELRHDDPVPLLSFRPVFTTPRLKY